MSDQLAKPLVDSRLSLPDPLPQHRGAVAIHTHGCKLNQADSNILARRFVEAGYSLVDSVAEADVFVLNTCTVTATADAKARQTLRAARRINPQALIVATGCYPQRAAEELSRLEAVSLVVTNTEKDNLISLVAAARSAEYQAGPAQFEPGVKAAYGVSASGPSTGRSRAMIKIQEGCDQVCAYCIVPKVRGRERSIPPETLIEQINQHTAEGYQEVVLTGTQLGTYGFDIPGASLRTLLQRILAETSAPRLRVSSLQPQEINQELLELWQDRRLCPHFHIPLQSGSDRILKAMRRRYDTARFAHTVGLVRRTIPDAGITTDLIVGFPGEGDTEFQESRDFVRFIGFSDMHIFPYSPRPGTSAAYFKDRVPELVKRERVDEMLALAKQGFKGFRASQLGQTRPVLWESARERNGLPAWSGLTDNYIRVYTHSQRDLRNTISPGQLMEVIDDWVYAGVF
jgi:threonylcarbamoyladenosine tRNA methylthiotransferase MtaB